MPVIDMMISYDPLKFPRENIEKTPFSHGFSYVFPVSSVFSSISTLADCVDSASAETAEAASAAEAAAAEEGVALQCDGEGSRNSPRSPVFSD